MSDVVIGIISRQRQNGDAEYILVKSNKNFGEFTGYWYPPGGHIQAGESQEDALVRELREELDIQVKPAKKIVQTPGDIEDQITYWWTCDVLSGEVKMNSDELAEVGWFTKQEMQDMHLWPSTRNFFAKYI